MLGDTAPAPAHAIAPTYSQWKSAPRAGLRGLEP